MRDRERNKAQEAKDEKFETIGDRVRARTELAPGLADTKSPKRVVAGLKASLKNPHTSADRKAEIRCYLRDPDGYLIEIGQATGMLEGVFADKPGEQQ